MSHMITHPVHRRSFLRFSAALPMTAGAVASLNQEVPLAVCMPIGVGAGHDLRAARIRAGALTMIRRCNATGGIYGRSIELVTFEDDGAPGRIAARLRELVRQRNVVAVLGTLGERASEAAAREADELRLPLVAPLSGAESLTRTNHRSVFRLRPDYAVEAAALASQLRGMGCSKVALIHDVGSLSGYVQSIGVALERQGLRVERIAWDSRMSTVVAASLHSMSTGGFQAAVVNVDPSAIEKMFEQGLGERSEWPGIIGAISSGDPGSLLGVFRRKDVAFTSVVPHPEGLARILTREFNEDVDKFGTGFALNFEGLESYLGARLIVEALRRLPAGRKPVAQDLQSLLEASPTWDIADFRLSFAKDRSTGSDWVNVAMRSRNGKLMAFAPTSAPGQHSSRDESSKRLSHKIDAQAMRAGRTRVEKAAHEQFAALHAA